MIAKPKSRAKAYEPVTIEITLETIQEAQAFYAIFNHTVISSETIGVTAAQAIKAAIQSEIGTPDYVDFHGKLCNRFR